MEQPGTGDFMRGIGPFVDTDGDPEEYSLFWAVEGRGRKSATCDLRKPEGQELFRRLAADRGRGVRELPARHPGGLGTRPRRARPAPGRSCASAPSARTAPTRGGRGSTGSGVAYGGLMHLTGEADRPPVRPGVTVADYLTGVFAAEAALAALYRRDAGGHGTGQGRSSTLLCTARCCASWNGRSRPSTASAWCGAAKGTGCRTRHRSTTTRLPTGTTCASSPVATPTSAGCAAPWVGLDLLEDARFATWLTGPQRRHHQRRGGRVDLHHERRRGGAGVHRPRRSGSHGVQRPGHRPRPPFRRPRRPRRGRRPGAGTLRQQAPYPRLIGDDQPVPCGAPQLGAHNREVWCDMVGVAPSELVELQAKGIV